MLTESTVVILESTPTNGVALLLAGQVHGTTEQSAELYVMGADGAAGLILDLVNVIRRDDELGDGRLAAEMRRLLGDLWAEHP
jgi:hypothetical protein